MHPSPKPSGTGQASVPILPLIEFAETCVFGKQSPGPCHCGYLGLPQFPPFGFPWVQPTVAPLLPKLRGQFAEFLGKGYPAPLSFLSPPTCVGLRNGHPRITARGFSRQCGVSSVEPSRALPFTAQLRLRTYLQPSSPNRLEGFATYPRSLASCVPAYSVDTQVVPEY